MKRIFTLFTLFCTMAAFCTIEAQNALLQQQFANTSKWQHAKRQHNSHFTAPQKAISQSDRQTEPINSFGTLYGPDGTEWMYTANFEEDMTVGYKSAHIEIFNTAGTMMGVVDYNFELAPHQTSVNQVMIDPNITKHFFNTDDNYEVILFVHATTDDYTGCVYQKVFPLTLEPSEPLMTIDGYEVMTTNMSADPNVENTQMVMFREKITEDYQYFVYFDIYGPANAESPDKPTLIHTFDFNYEYIEGSGSASMPLCIQNIGGKAHYAVAYFEQPYFDPSIPFYEEPVVTPDNNYIIELYTEESFNTTENVEAKPYNTIKIPITTEEGYIYSIPNLGSFMGNDDFAVGIFDNTEKPYFVITHDNYEAASDNFISSFYLYDENGNLIKTIAEKATDYMQMNPIDGTEQQYCLTNDDLNELQFLNIPSCKIVATIPYTVDDRLLSTAIDRIPVGDSYQIVISGSNGDSDYEGNVLHPIAYFDADGTLNHWDKVNLGPDVVMAQPAIIANWLNPHLFDTDDNMEYMFLVKMPVSTESSKTETRLWVLETNGTHLADFGPSDEYGELSSIKVINSTSDSPILSITYYKWEASAYTLTFTSLPFTDTAVDHINNQASPFSLANGQLTSQGMIEVFTPAGEKIASGFGHVTASQLQPGLYIVRAAGQSTKIVVK